MDMKHSEASLDNPAWHALTNQHAPYALGDGLARRYQKEFVSFAAVAEPSSAAFAQLAALIAPNDVIAMLGTTPPLRDGWTMLMQIPLLQMVYHGTTLPSPEPTHSIQSLSNQDLPAIMQLIELTRPGPFQPRSIELGHFIGIWQGDTLAAMAGERIHLPGYREISAVCTHPDFQRRGHARQLTQQLMYEIQIADELPFLHLFEDNKSAQALYTSLGFRTRMECSISILKRQG